MISQLLYTDHYTPTCGLQAGTRQNDVPTACHRAVRDQRNERPGIYGFLDKSGETRVCCFM